MINNIFRFKKPFLVVFPVFWLILFILLISIDLGSKKWVTQNLNFPKWNSAGFHVKSGYKSLPATTNKSDKIDLVGLDGRIFKLRLVFNDKFVFGLGPEFARGQGMIVSYLFTAFAIFILFLYRWKNPDLGNPYAWLLVFSGAFGNLIDKFYLKSLTSREWTFSLYPREGYVNGVVDFFECIWFDWDNAPIGFLQWQTWPTFNMADSFIVVGMILLLFTMNEEDTKTENTTEMN